MQNVCMQIMSVNCEYSILKTDLGLVILFSKLGEKNTYLAYCNFFSFDFKYEQSSTKYGIQRIKLRSKSINMLIQHK